MGGLLLHFTSAHNAKMHIQFFSASYIYADETRSGFQLPVACPAVTTVSFPIAMQAARPDDRCDGAFALDDLAALLPQQLPQSAAPRSQPCRTHSAACTATCAPFHALVEELAQSA